MDNKLTTKVITKKLSKTSNIITIVNSIILVITLTCVYYMVTFNKVKINDEIPLPYFAEQMNQLIDGRYALVTNAQLQGMLLYKTSLMIYIQNIDPYNTILLNGNIAYIDSIYNVKRVQYEREIVNE